MSHSLLNKLKEVGEYKNVGELELNQEYKILKLEVKEIEYGKSILTTLENSRGEKCNTYLPKRFRQAFSDHDILAYNGMYLLI